MTSSHTVRALGALRGVYHVRLTPFVISILFVLFLSFVYALFCLIAPFVISLKSESMRGFAIVVGVVKGLTVVWAFPFACWRVFGRMGDELRIFENGFTYRRGKELFTCLWSEIADRSGVLGRGSVVRTTEVVRSDGRRIHFSDQMRGLDEISRHCEEVEFHQISAAERDGSGMIDA